MGIRESTPLMGIRSRRIHVYGLQKEKIVFDPQLLQYLQNIPRINVPFNLPGPSSAAGYFS